MKTLSFSLGRGGVDTQSASSSCSDKARRCNLDSDILRICYVSLAIKLCTVIDLQERLNNVCSYEHTGSFSRTKNAERRKLGRGSPHSGQFKTSFFGSSHDSPWTGLFTTLDPRLGLGRENLPRLDYLFRHTLLSIMSITLKQFVQNSKFLSSLLKPAAGLYANAAGYRQIGN